MVSRAWALALLACQCLAVINRHPEPGVPDRPTLMIPGRKVARRKRSVIDTPNAELSYKLALHMVGEAIETEAIIGDEFEFVKLDIIESKFVIFPADCATCPAVIEWHPDEAFTPLTDAEESVFLFNEGGCKISAAQEGVWDEYGSLAEGMEVWVAKECQFDDPSRKVEYAAVLGLGPPSCNKGHQKVGSIMYRTEGEGIEEESQKANGTHPPRALHPNPDWHRKMVERKERQQKLQQQKEERQRKYESGDLADHPAKPANETEMEWEAHTPENVITAPYPHSKMPLEPKKKDKREMDKACEQSTLLSTWSVKRFAVCMHDGHSSYGYLWINPADPSEDPKVKSHPIAGKNFWAVKVWDLHFRKDGKPFKPTLGLVDGGVAIFDTTTPVLGLPHSIYAQMEDIWQTEEVDCHDMSQMLHLAFNMGESKKDAQGIELESKAWLAQRYGMTTAQVAGDTTATKPPHNYPGPYMGCESMIQDIGEAMTDHGPLIVLGKPWFEQYKTTFHNPPDGSLYITVQHADPTSCDATSLIDMPAFKREAGAGMAQTSRRSARDLPIPHYVPLKGEILMM